MTTLIAKQLNLTPLVFRIVAWAAMTAYTVYTAPSLQSRVAAGVLMGVGATALQFRRLRDRRLSRAAFLIATIGGLAACYAAHDGLAPVLAAVAASRLPDGFEGRWVPVLTAIDAVAFGVTIAYVSGSPAGALAGLGIPLLVQRELEHHELLRQRDRAQALLAEAQNAREAEAQAAALRERGRIAREIHDVLAHSLAGLSLQLQAARAVAGREEVPQTVLEPLDKAAALARDGLKEARAAVGALRDPAGLGLDALPALVDRHPGQATLAVRGEPAQLDAEAGHAVYRAVQEALTNAARYAPGSAVNVEMTWDAHGLTVSVRDAGPAPGRQAVTGQGSGLGLAGMSERIRQAGGHAAGRARRGWWLGGTASGADTDERAGASAMIRVVLADDQAVVRDGLRLLLEASGEVQVLGVARDGAEAVQVVVEQHPDVALLDLRMPRLDGAQATAALATKAPSVRVLILTTYADDDAILPALRAGAAGYLTKDASGDELVAALREVAAGRTVLDPHVQRRLVELVRGDARAEPVAAAPSADAAPLEQGLTRREVDVVRLVAEGLSNQQIARRLVVSEATVKTHLNHVLSKLDVDGRPGLVAWAWRHGLAGR